MQVRWYGQSAFALTTADTAVFIDPFFDIDTLTARGWRFDYPAIAGVEADVLLITHEHVDHNGDEAVGGDPAIIRSTAGTFETAAGEVVAIAAEHDDAAGTKYGPDTIFVLTLDGLRVAHFGDYGQRALREEQVAAIGSVDLVLVPVGGGATIGGAQAREVVDVLGPRWVVPMHYRTPRTDFMEPADAFLTTFGDAVHRTGTPSFDTGELRVGAGPIAVVPAVP